MLYAVKPGADQGRGRTDWVTNCAGDVASNRGESPRRWVVDAGLRWDDGLREPELMPFGAVPALVSVGQQELDPVVDR
jgi:hypothetical protein